MKKKSIKGEAARQLVAKAARWNSLRPCQREGVNQIRRQALNLPPLYIQQRGRMLRTGKADIELTGYQEAAIEEGFAKYAMNSGKTIISVPANLGKSGGVK